MDRNRQRSAVIIAIVALVMFLLCLTTSGPAQVYALKQEAQDKWSNVDQLVFVVVYWPVILIYNTSDAGMNCLDAYVRMCGEEPNN